MKRKFLFLICLCACVVASADERKSIDITPNQSAPVELNMGACKLYISASKDSGREEVRLSVEVENPSETHLLYLFNRSFAEKDLKKQKPSIRFDKKLYNGSHEIKTCKSEDGEDLILIPQSDKRILLFKGRENSVVSIELPLYITKYKKKGFLSSDKYLILQREIVILEVKVKNDDEEVYKRINDAYEDLMEDLGRQTFCPNKKHDTSLSAQKKPFEDKIDELKDEISEIKSKNNWRERDADYKKYKDLLGKLNDINLKKYERDCGQHVSSNRGSRTRDKISTPAPVIQSPKSSMSADQVLSSMVQIYRQLDNGDIDKSAAARKAKSLKGTWDSGVSSSADASTKRKVERYYDSIVNY